MLGDKKPTPMFMKRDGLLVTKEDVVNEQEIFTPGIYIRGISPFKYKAPVRTTIIESFDIQDPKDILYSKQLEEGGQHIGSLLHQLRIRIAMARASSAVVSRKMKVDY
jgi:hypothetical protein